MTIKMTNKTNKQLAVEACRYAVRRVLQAIEETHERK